MELVNAQSQMSTTEIYIKQAFLFIRKKSVWGTVGRLLVYYLEQLNMCLDTFI